MTADTSPDVSSPCSPDRAAWADESGVCGDCIPWNAPLRLHVPHGTPALTFAGWCLWHLHVRLHQGLGGRT